MSQLTHEHVREIAEKVAEAAAEKAEASALRAAEVAAHRAAEVAADRAIDRVLTALGIDPTKLHEEQRVWAFARTMQQGANKGVFALFTGFLTALSTLIAGAIWYVFFNKH
jgi:hypothetical protein